MSTETVPKGYKRTEVGVIPEEWEVKPLSSTLVKGRLGGNYPNSIDATAFPLMKMGNISRGVFDLNKIEYIPSGLSPDPIHQLTNGDVLFNTRNSLDLVGKVAIWRGELPVAYYNSNLMRFEFDSTEICSNEFANYYLNAFSTVMRLRALAIGTTSVAAIYGRDLRNLMMIVPPKAEQRAIAAALSDADALIESLEQLLAKKRQIKQGAMQELLTGKRRLPGFEIIPGFKQTEIGAIPEDWEVTTVGAEFSMQLGKMLDSANNSGIEKPFIGNRSVQWGMINCSDLGVIKLTSSDLSKYRLCYGDIVVCEGGEIGRSAIWDDQIEECYFQKALHRLRPKRNFNRRLFIEILRRYAAIGYLQNFVTQTSIAHLPKDKFELVQIPQAPTAEQSAIATALSNMDTELEALEGKLDKARQVKQGMMQQLLTGKVRLV